MRVLYFISLLIILSSCFSSRQPSLAQQAEEYLRQERFEEAISAYRHHIEARLSDKTRPEWENPFFYLLLIGDIELRQGELEAALSTFEEAERAGVDPLLVSDRFRYVARMYEADNKLKEALNVLQRYRDRDAMLYDLILDRVAKELSAQEESEAVTH